MTIGGAISGSGVVVVKASPGAATLSGASSYSGGTRLEGGTLIVASDTALGTGTLTLAGGALQAQGAPTLANAVALGTTTTVGGTGTLTLAGAVTLDGFNALNVTNTARTTISGVVGESSTSIFIKRGGGELALTGANTYTGGTLIAEGTVRIGNLSGSAFGTGAVTVAAGATLTGPGSFSGALQNNGTFSPGASPTISHLASFAQGGGATLVMELGGLLPGTGYDQLDVAGSFVAGGTLEVDTIYGFVPESGSIFDLFNYGSMSGSFTALTLPTLAAGLHWDTSALYTNGTLSVAGTAVPEPATTAAIFGALVLAGAGWRRRSASRGGLRVRR